MRRRFFNIKNRMLYNHIKYSSSNYAIINFQSDFTNVAIVSNIYNRVKNEGILICAGNINNIYESPWEKAELCNISLPDSVKLIGAYAFYNCTILTSVTIGNRVTTIGDFAFGNCNSLTSITIPESVTSIGWNTFQSCVNLTSVYCKATTPPALGLYVFYNNGLGRKIYVPTGSVNAYKSATNWREYASDIVGYNF